jgi:CCR4-NOT transcription complex subunit 2
MLSEQNNYAIKLNQATHPAWSSPNPTQQPQSQTVLPPSNPFGTTSTSTATATQNGAHPSTTTNPPPGSQQQQLPAPPGVAPPPPQPPQPPTGAVSSNAYVQSQVQVPGGQLHPPPLPNAYAANGDAAPSPAHPATATATATHPQTPAQQVLISAADRWGLLGLLAVIKGAGREVDGGLSSVGTDLGTMGLDMSFQGCPPVPVVFSETVFDCSFTGRSLYPTFITPWADQSAAHTVEPDFHLPACYNVQPPPPGPNKAAAFSDETLFFMFYSHPRDALQEVAAQELSALLFFFPTCAPCSFSFTFCRWNRNWRYHKERRLWITKETGTTPSQKVAGGEQGSYTIWDAENWAKERKEMAVLYADLEEKNHPVFAGAGLVLAQQQGMQGAATTAAGGQTQQQQQVQQAQQQQQQQVHAQGLAPQGQVQQGQRVAFPMSMGL